MGQARHLAVQGHDAVRDADRNPRAAARAARRSPRRAGRHRRSVRCGRRRRFLALLPARDMGLEREAAEGRIFDERPFDMRGDRAVAHAFGRPQMQAVHDARDGRQRGRMLECKPFRGDIRNLARQRRDAAAELDRDTIAVQIDAPLPLERGTYLFSDLSVVHTSCLRSRRPRPRPQQRSVFQDRRPRAHAQSVTLRAPLTSAGPPCPSAQSRPGPRGGRPHPADPARTRRHPVRAGICRPARARRCASCAPHRR